MASPSASERNSAGSIAPARPRVLICYSLQSTYVQTLFDYLRSFGEFLDTDVEYLHVTYGAVLNCSFEDYDVVINTCCVRHIYEWCGESYKDALRRYSGVKILIVQDEYDRTDSLKAEIKRIGFDIVLTCVPPESIEYVYPRAEFPNVRFERVLTGYVPDYLAERRPTLIPLADRPIVVGYRGRDIGGRYGKLAFEKFEIGRRMKEVCEARGIAHDIAMDDESRIYGPAWFDFIGSCRAMLGSESGSNVFDFDGSIERRCREIAEANGGKAPDYQAVRQYVEQRDEEISMGQASPRIFECAVMKTPMILFRGPYSGVVEPDTHYIPLEKDFSNVEEVLGKLNRLDEIDAMRERAYEHLVGSGRFGYRAFMRQLRSWIDETLSNRQRSRPIVEPIDLSLVPPPERNLIEIPAKEPRRNWDVFHYRYHLIREFKEVQRLETWLEEKIQTCLAEADEVRQTLDVLDDEAVGAWLGRPFLQWFLRFHEAYPERRARWIPAAGPADIGVSTKEEYRATLELFEKRIGAIWTEVGGEWETAHKKLREARAAATGHRPDLRKIDITARMWLTQSAQRNDDGVSVSASNAQGYFMHGPYLVLPAGRYRATIDLRVEDVQNSANPSIAVDATPVGVRALAMQRFSTAELSRGPVSIEFSVPARCGSELTDAHPIEIRLNNLGTGRPSVKAVVLEKLKPRRLFSILNVLRGLR